MHRLKNVALLHVAAVADHADAVGSEELMVPRKRRLHLRRAQIGEDQPGDLHARIGGMRDGALEGAGGRLGRHVDNFAVLVESPAVVEAAETIILHAAVEQRRAAMAAVLAEQTRHP